ncbi:hypothetical protein GCM10010278_75920 [Streptomyces melanogenes]|nr:hypothetical protein GCM10010278_75920 [Streptomyces melanogenes]
MGLNSSESMGFRRWPGRRTVGRESAAACPYDAGDAEPGYVPGVRGLLPQGTMTTCLSHL